MVSASIRKKILVVEDDRSLNKLLVTRLERLDYDVTGVETGKEARTYVARTIPDLILLDIMLPDCSGLDLLVDFAAQAPVITMTAFGTVDQAVKAVRTGASDYLVKPVSIDALELAIERVFATAELKRDVAFWQSQAQRTTNSAIIGDSPELSEMRNLIDLYAAAGSTVLIEGESGTGKELVARALHATSDRADQRFVPIDCDPSAENTILSELFGYEKGAFSGAESRRDGMLELADGGTIYLSDIAEVSQALQSKILRVLESGTFRKQGGAEDISTNVRIIVGTCHDLHDLVESGDFRSELYFRLSAYRIIAPSLRDRRSDVIALARHFLETRSFQRGVEKILGPETVEALEKYDWPGNVRELSNAIERGVIVSGAAPEILPKHLSIPTGQNMGDHGGSGAVALRFSSEPTMEGLRAQYLQFLLDRHDGNRRKVAGILGISERNTYRLIPRLGSKP